MAGRTIIVPLQPLLAGGIVAGMGMGAGMQRVLADEQGHGNPGAMFAGVITGFGLMGASLAGGMKIERMPGPFRSRWSVDAVEQVTRRTVSMHWSPKATLIGTVLAGAGLGIAWASLAGYGTNGFGEPPK